MSEPASLSRIKCPSCGNWMHPEVHAEVELDRCPFCEGLWLDAAELKRCMVAGGKVPANYSESSIPNRGISGRTCPRCRRSMESAGWSGLNIERCMTCFGLYLDGYEFKAFLQDGVPGQQAVLEQWLLSSGWKAGWNLLGTAGLLELLARVLWALGRR